MTEKGVAMPFIFNSVIEVRGPMCFLYENDVFVAGEMIEGGLAAVRRAQAKGVDASNTAHDGNQKEMKKDELSHGKC